MKSWSEKLLYSVVEIFCRIYVDDFILGGFIIIKIKEFKSDVVIIFFDVGFELYKWYFNVLELEENFCDCVNGSEDIFIK